MTDTRPLGEEEIKHIQGMAEDYKVGNDWWILRAVPNLCKALREANALICRFFDCDLDGEAFLEDMIKYVNKHNLIDDGGSTEPQQG